MKNRLRFGVILVVGMFMAGWCGSDVRAQERAKPRNRDRGHAQPQERMHRDDAQRRHPRSDGRYDRNRNEGHRDYGRYRWRDYSHRQRWDYNQSPRYYRNRHPFSWPYAYARAYHCGWYWVPTDRRLMYDPYSGQEYWEYTDYRYVLRCFD